MTSLEVHQCTSHARLRTRSAVAALVRHAALPPCSVWTVCMAAVTLTKRPVLWGDARAMADRLASLNVVSPDAEALFFGAVTRCAELHRAGSLGELRAVLERRLDGPIAPMTLDLLGHSTRDHHLLRLGHDRIDMLDPGVARFFQALADEHLLSRLAVVAVRLLGCETAVSPSGQRTLRLLARTLRLPVFGTRTPLLKSHYDALGFDPAFAHILVEASESSSVGRAAPMATPPGTGLAP